MAYTFLKAKGCPTGGSLVEPDLLATTQKIEQAALQHGVDLNLPSDHLVASSATTGIPHETIDVTDHSIGRRLGLDIGPRTISTYENAIKSAQTVVWNGPMGVFEIREFANGTLAVAEAVANSDARTVVGGGDSIAAINKAGVTNQITHISTGGGASLELLGGRTLPGVEILPDR